MTEMLELPKAYIKHRMPGRIRLKIPAMRGNPSFFDDLTETLAGCEHLVQLNINSATASVLIQHGDASFEAIADFAADAGLFMIEDQPEPAPSLSNHMSIASLSSLAVTEIDRQLNHVSAGRVDLRSLLFLGFTGLTIHQAAKGHIMSPASTFFWRALELLNSKNEKMFDKKFD